MICDIGIIRARWLLGVIVFCAPITAWGQIPLVSPSEPARLVPLGAQNGGDQERIHEELPRPVRVRSGRVLGGELLGLSDIGQISTDIAPPADPKGKLTLPTNEAKGVVPTSSTLVHSFIDLEPRYRGYLAPGSFCHRPTYFEETRLERYGHGPNRLIQPLVSGARFGLNVASLPYKMVVEPPRRCHFHSYPFETGGIAPHYFEGYPVDRRAALVEMATIAGLILILP